MHTHTSTPWNLTSEAKSQNSSCKAFFFLPTSAEQPESRLSGGENILYKALHPPSSDQAGLLRVRQLKGSTGIVYWIQHPPPPPHPSQPPPHHYPCYGWDHRYTDLILCKSDCLPTVICDLWTLVGKARPFTSFAHSTFFFRKCVRSPYYLNILSL